MASEREKERENSKLFFIAFFALNAIGRWLLLFVDFAARISIAFCLLFLLLAMNVPKYWEILFD